MDLKLGELHPLNIIKSLGIEADHLRLDRDDGNKNSTTNGGSGESTYDVALRSIQVWMQPETADDKVINFNRTKQQIFDDAFMSFDYTLRNSIFTSDGPLEKAAKDALLAWLELLQKSLPRAYAVQHIVEALLENFEVIASKESILLETLDKLNPPVGEWSPGCTNGEVGMGYTCGLWSLFHISSVGLVEWNRLGPNSVSLKKEMVLAANWAADTLRNFIFYFFGCEECRVHFVNAYDSCFLDRCNRLTDTSLLRVWKRYPIWLFEMHNSVNVRLLKERATTQNITITDEDEANKRWPLPQVCPKCWQTDGSSNEDAVFKYLRIEYW